MATPYRLKRSAISGKRPQLSDLQLGELALNFNDGYLFAERDTGGVGIGQTVTLLTPWVENLGGGSIFYENSVGVGTTSPTSALTVLGLTSTTDLFVTGVSTFVGVGTFNSNVFIDGQLFVSGIEIDGGSSLGLDITTRHLNASGITTLASLEVSGSTSTQHLNVSGITTIGSAVTISSAGINLSGIVTAAGGFNIGIQSGGTNVTTGVITALNFVGAGNSFTYNVGTKTVDINIGGGQWTYADTSNTTESSIFRVNGNVGLGTTNPTSKLTVDGNGLFTGVVTATTFIGNLTGTATTATKVQTSLSGAETDYFLMMGFNAVGDNNIRLDSGLKYHTLENVLTVNNNINATGVITATTFNGQVNSGLATITTLESTNSTLTNINSSGITTLATLGVSGVTTTQHLEVTGVSTFIGAITGTISTATKLTNARTFEITGDIIAAPISFDGTGNVSLAATIQPNSVGLGTDTTGDYVQSIVGTSNQITVTGGTGEISNPVISLPNNLVVPQDLTVTRDLQVNRDLNVTGNITIGGTSATLFTTELKISDPDIVLGFRTDSNNNDVSTDNTANHGGVALASTEGTPLVDLFIAGIETNPSTYKKIMWFKEGTFSGLGTDAWLINYAVGIGSTQFPNGTRLAAGNVQFTQDDLAVVKDINASGIVTAQTFVGQINSGLGTVTTLNSTNLTGTNLSGTIGTVTTLSSTNGTITNLSGTIGTVTTLNSTNGTITNLSGTIGTVTNFNTTNLSGTIGTVTTLNSTNLTGTNLSGTIGTITTLSGTTGTITNLSSTNLSGTIGTITTLNSTNLILTNINSSGITTLATLEVSETTTTQNLNVSGVATVGSAVTISSGGINITGVLTASNGIQGIGIQSGGIDIATGIITSLNFVGSALSTVTSSGGVVSINVKSGEFTKTTTNFTATSGQTTFNVNYTPNYVDVYVNGVRLTASEFTATNGTSVVLSEGANDGDVVDIVVYENSGLFNGSKWIASDLNNPISGTIYKINGSVGLGTTNPEAKLHVIGDTIFTRVGLATTSINSTLELGRTNIYYVGVTSLTLPPNPTIGDRIEVINRSGITTAVLLSNGSAIMGVVDDMELDVIDGAFTLTYANVTDGWVVGR